jgi:predicted molibdopterin-dependent oxidoreductase YjgC
VQKLVSALSGTRTRTKAIDEVVAHLEGREGPVVVIVGRPSVAEAADATVHAASLLAGVPEVRFLSALRRGNVHGALDLGLAPGFLPGRVTLDAGREHVAAEWGSVPETRGLDATGILRGAAEGTIKALVVVGADVLADFPDRELAKRALETVERLVVVGAFGDDVAGVADVLLPTTVWGEHAGSTTNLEGRVMRLGRKVAPEGAPMPAWRIATELAARLGADFDLETVDEVDEEIARVAPAFAGVTPSLLRRARDGVVLPIAEHADEISFGVGRIASGFSWEPIPPTPEASGETNGEVNGDHAQPELPVPPVPLHVWDRAAEAPSVPLTDAYALRLVAGRTLYGADRVVAESPSVAKLAPGARLHVNPRDRERIGVAEGMEVRVVTGSRSLEIPVVSDARVPSGVGVIPFNQRGPGASELIDPEATVIDLRVETLS